MAPLVRFDHPNVGSDRLNAGDKVLTEVFSYFIQNTLSADSAPYIDCHRYFDDAHIELLNSADGVVVGGGGLFLYDTYPNLYSDWQWGVTPSQIEKLEVPVAVVAAGYNRFRGQRRFTKAFDRSVTALVDRAAYFGMRHGADIEKLRAHLPSHLWDRVTLHFCPTLLYNRERWGFTADLDSGEVGVSVAGDRLGHRHHDVDLYLEQLGLFLQYLRQLGKRVSLITHMAADAWVRDRIAFDYVVDMSESSSEEIYRAFAKFELVVSDRGHGQLLPFAVGSRILTPVTHDKLSAFLADVGLSDLGVEAGEPDLARRMIEAFERSADPAEYRRRWRRAMNEIACVNATGDRALRRALARS